MNPMPCRNCGWNFMKNSSDPNDPQLCNNCLAHDQRKNTEKQEKLDNVSILINCPKKIQKEIEEICIREGIDFAKYFLGLHKKNTEVVQVEENKKIESEDQDENLENHSQKRKYKKNQKNEN